MSGAAWRLERVDGVVLVRCAPLCEARGIAHAWSTRLSDDGDGFDLGPAIARERAEEERRVRFVRAAGFEGDRPSTMHQVHGNGVIRAEVALHPPDADAAVWTCADSPVAIPSVRSADCVAILLVDRDGMGAAAVHAGWRGTALSVAARAVEALAASGVPPSRLLAGLGPAILNCCYEVDGDVADAVSMASGGAGPQERGAGKVRIDLHDANRRQLARAGVEPSRIHSAPWCTRCRADLFFSFRRDGARAGRMMASVGAARRPPSPRP